MLFKAIYFLLKIIIIPIPNLSGSLIDTFPINISNENLLKIHDFLYPLPEEK